MTLLKEIEWYRGDSYPIPIIIEVNDVVFDITGYTFIMSVDTEEDPPDATTLLFAVAGVLGTPADGEVSFTPTASNTDLDPGEYYYDIQWVDTSANIRTIGKNVFTILQDISK